MQTQTSQRIVLGHVQDHNAAHAVVRWARRLPGMISVSFQSETGELLVTYDVRWITLAWIRQHLQRGGIHCDGSLIERLHLAAVYRHEQGLRRAAGVPDTAEGPVIPLVTQHCSA